MNRRMAAALALAGSVACRPVGAPPPTPVAPTPGAEASAPEEPAAAPVPRSPGPACPAGPLQSLLETANLARTDRGLPPLHPDRRLAEAARTHARDLADHDIRGHRGSDGSLPGDRATRAGYGWSVVGENVAAGYTGASAVVSGWMASPPHRDNLLAPEFREVGLARVDGPPATGPVWVMVLGRRPEAPEGPPGCVA